MATVAVGDIHGNLLALNDILGQLRSEITGGDTVVFLGDYIDRVPDSKGCVEAILGFQRNTSAEVVFLRGNPYQGTETVAYGHWNNAEMDSQGWPTPRIVGSTIGIDTIAHGVLTAVRLPDRRLFQSAQYRLLDTDAQHR
jgi:Calcineurin-like phosphoesterase.